MTHAHDREVDLRDATKVLLERMREDLEVHDGDVSRPGFQALLVHRFGNWRMHIRSKPARAPFSVLYRVLERCIVSVYGIEIPYSAEVGRNVIIEHQGGVIVHGDAKIGDGSVLRQGVTLGNRTPERPFDAPTIGEQVNVGAGAKILGAVRVGDGAKIGANAVVLTDVPPGSVAVGVPAKVHVAESPSASEPSSRTADRRIDPPPHEPSPQRSSIHGENPERR